MQWPRQTPRPLTVAERLLPEDLRRRLADAGWEVTPGNPKVNRGPADALGGDRLVCPDCTARREKATTAALARPRVKTLDVSKRLGPGWCLTQREGDAERQC